VGDLKRTRKFDTVWAWSFKRAFSLALRRPARAKARWRSFLRLLEANGPQDYPNNDDEEAEPDRVDDQLLEPLRGQSNSSPGLARALARVRALATEGGRDTA
jgi:hypothetical protein